MPRQAWPQLLELPEAEAAPAAVPVPPATLNETRVSELKADLQRQLEYADTRAHACTLAHTHARAHGLMHTRMHTSMRSRTRARKRILTCTFACRYYLSKKSDQAL